MSLCHPPISLPYDNSSNAQRKNCVTFKCREAWEGGTLSTLSRIAFEFICGQWGGGRGGGGVLRRAVGGASRGGDCKAAGGGGGEGVKEERVRETVSGSV